MSETLVPAKPRPPIASKPPNLSEKMVPVKPRPPIAVKPPNLSENQQDTQKPWSYTNVPVSEEDQPGESSFGHPIITSSIQQKSTSPGPKKATSTPEAGKQPHVASVGGFQRLRDLYREYETMGTKKFGKALLKQLFPEKGNKGEDKLALYTHSLEEDLKKSDFLSSVEALLDRVFAFGRYFGLLSNIEELLEVMRRLEDKRIIVSVFGRFNTGKSTLLNAILAVRVLPTKRESETTVKVLIKDSPSLHRGPCPHADEQDGYPCPKCLYLEREVGQDSTEAFHGEKNIRDFLQHANKDGRKQKMEGEYTLVANVPAIRGVTDPWKVYLVDNPGCGDAHEGVNDLAHGALKSSQAYVYLVHYRQLGDQDDYMSFKTMHERDPDVFRQQRLVVVVTHFDVYYTSLADHDKITAEEIKRRVCQTVKEATGEEFPREMVVPVCSQWANAARQLKFKSNDSRMQRVARKFLLFYDELPRGQGQVMDVESLQSWELARTLEDASGITALEEKVQAMASSCAKIWKHSLENDCARFVREGTESLTFRIKNLGESLRAMDQVHDEQKLAIDDIHGHLEALKQKMKKRSSDVYQELENTYLKDVDKTAEVGQQTAEEMGQQFFEKVKQRAKTQQYGSREFDEEVETFLNKTSTTLEKMFGNAQFSKMHEVLTKHLMSMAAKHSTLVSVACKLCGMDHRTLLSDETQSDEHDGDLDPEKVIKEKPPELKHLKDTLQNVEPLLTRWKKFWKRIRSVFMGNKEELSAEQLSKMTDQLRGEIRKECTKYFKDIQPKIVEFFFEGYCSRTKARLEVYKKHFEDSGKIAEQEQSIAKMEEIMKRDQEEMTMLQKWCDHLRALERRIHEQA